MKCGKNDFVRMTVDEISCDAERQAYERKNIQHSHVISQRSFFILIKQGGIL